MSTRRPFPRRVDAYLDGMPFGAPRAKFLASQLDQWVYRFQQFQLGLVVVTTAADPPEAYDYVTTISGLQKRLTEASRG